LEELHQYHEMMNYLSYPSHGTQHQTVNTSQNQQAVIKGNLQFTQRIRDLIPGARKKVYLKKNIKDSIHIIMEKTCSMLE